MNQYYTNPAFAQQQNNGYNYGYGYAAQQPDKALCTQPLTDEVIAMLKRNNTEALDVKISQMESYRNSCTHRSKSNGMSTLVPEGNGMVRCTICGAVFRMMDLPLEDVITIKDTMINLLQTSKAMFLDIPEEFTTQYYQIISLLDKFPTLWKIANANMGKYENTNPAANVNQYGPAFNGFNAMQNLLNGTAYAPFAGQNNPAGFQQPNAVPFGYNNPQMQPNYFQQPMQPAYNMQNPVAYGAPGPISQPPVAPTPGVMPTSQGTTPPAPTATSAATPAAPQEEIQQQQTWNV